MKAVQSVVAEAGRGLVGDRYHGAKHRHVTVQTTGELEEAAVKAGVDIDPGLTRRNITIDADYVPRDPDHRWTIGGVELEVIRDAAPCRLMEEIFGPTVRAALRRRAGVVCRVLSDGEISIGDAVDLGDAADLGTAAQQG